MTDSTPLVVPDDETEELLVFLDDHGLLVQGDPGRAELAIAQLLERSGIDTRDVTRVSLSEAAAVGATGMALAASSGEYLRLTAESAQKVKELGEQFDANGALRGYVRDNGRFAGQLGFEKVPMAAEQALALQTAAVSLALRSAIKNVQEAVERVEGKVDRINRHLASRLRGDVIGTYRHLNDVVEATNARGYLLEADWDSVAGVRNQLNQDLETMRSFINAEAAELRRNVRVPKRESMLKAMHAEPGNVGDVLALMLVVEQSLHLYEYLRLQHVRHREPQHVTSALSDARKTLEAHASANETLVAYMRGAIEAARVVEPLEIHRVISRRGLKREASAADARVRDFAFASRLSVPAELADLEDPELADAREEVRRRAGLAAEVGKHLGSEAARGTRHAAGAVGSTAKSRLSDLRRSRREQHDHPEVEE